jgi:hypothetical protein
MVKTMADAPDTEPGKKPLMRNLGEFFGHIAKAVRTDPAKRVVRTDVQEERRDNMVLRRTTIEEIEIRPDDARSTNDAPTDDQPDA